MNSEADRHKGHRQRLRERYIKEGIEGFEDHEALELLLFYAIPRINTNNIAHELLDTFGSLKNLFAADAKDIAKVPGVGKNTAALIKIIPDLAARFWFSQDTKKTKIASIAAAADFARSLLHGKPHEHFYVASIDPSFNVKATELISRGSATEANVPVRQIMESIIRNGVDKALIMHNHPAGRPNPSMADIELTKNVLEAAAPMKIQIIDHIIVGENAYYSFTEQQLINNDISADKARAAQYSGGVMNAVGHYEKDD